MSEFGVELSFGGVGRREANERRSVAVEYQVGVESNEIRSGVVVIDKSGGGIRVGAGGGVFEVDFGLEVVGGAALAGLCLEKNLGDD